MQILKIGALNIQKSSHTQKLNMLKQTTIKFNYRTEIFHT